MRSGWRYVDSISQGSRFEEAAAAARCSTKTVQRLLGSVGGMPARGTTRAKLRLSLAEREEISRGLGGEESYRAMARRLGRAPSTISREVNGNGGRRQYRAVRADASAYQKAGRPKLAKLRRCPRLRARVESMLNKLGSPQQIRARLRFENPDDPELRVSHETIDQSLYCSIEGSFTKGALGVPSL